MYGNFENSHSNSQRKKNKTKHIKERYFSLKRRDNGPYLSDPSLRQRSFASSGAVLDVTGGGEGEKSQDAQREQGVRHRCWLWMSAAHLCVLRLAGCLSDAPVDSSLINTWTWPDNATDSRIWRQCRTALLYTRTRARRPPECVRRACERSQQMWLCIRCVPSNKSTRENSSDSRRCLFCIQDCATLIWNNFYE